ncbi:MULTISPECIES: hypothetical protein [unclassified Chryseobacterium]|uniref:hypothetical protein n=1 Tax=unclassified Chryseobacterium TaxID=2593645 RepID=UPI0028536FC9|nr:hypothetical protein [Chryseobacterium sp. CFS7]MDR4892246.1 hypothetical protein [Chryseobacterium sp. CFS7]
MSEFKGTKGNLSITGEKYFVIDCRDSGTVKTIATVNTTSIPIEEAKGNATIFIKSYAMLEILKEVERSYLMYAGNIPYQLFERIENIIKVATELK